MANTDEIDALHGRLDTAEHTIATLEKGQKELELRFGTLLRTFGKHAKQMTARERQVLNRQLAARARASKRG